MNSSTNRREFLQAATASIISAGMVNATPPPSPLKISVFSKHLHFLEWEAMANAAKEIGFDGVDLTLRKDGHIEPERAEQDLPKVAEIIRKAGLEFPMITAGIIDANSPNAEPILRAMKSAGVKNYRWGGFKYDDAKPIPVQLETLKKDAAKLAELNRKYDVCAMYHTHSGLEVGASIWDLWMILKDLDTKRVGVNLDVCHATIEGGVGGWMRSTQLVAPMTRGIAIKDFKWAKNAKGEWTPAKCPLGEGMVNYKKFFALMKAANFSGPVQMHFEYPLGGADKGAKTLTIKKEEVFAAMKKDLTVLRGWLREAGL
jgi:sugar phosphate isomerase/epimerase